MSTSKEDTRTPTESAIVHRTFQQVERLLWGIHRWLNSSRSLDPPANIEKLNAEAVSV